MSSATLRTPGTASFPSLKPTADYRVGPSKKPGTVSSTPGTRMFEVGTWTLRSTEFVELEPPENTEALFYGTRGEAVIGEDGRTKVHPKDYMPNGKYRGIVKLFLRYAGQKKGGPWAMGTGWLINNDTIVTAGHCVYDWSHQLGQLTHVKAYIGYHGKESIKDARSVQLRTGKRVAVPGGWLASNDNAGRDVAFIQVDRPFTGVKAIQYQPTPPTGSKVVLGVVGYPGDLMNPKTKEKGAFMYEMFHPITYDIAKSKAEMLQYTIDTYGGNSGSPVLRKKDMTSIGVHVLGGNPNSGSVISGPKGNPFDALAAALKEKPKRPTGETGEEATTTTGGEEANWFSTVTVPTTELGPEETEADGENVGGAEANLEAEEAEADTPETQESFLKFLKKALKVTGPFGMIASVGLSAVGKLLKKKKRESSLDEAYSFEGVLERALVGEAALEAVIQLGPAKCKDLGIFKRMQPIVRRLRPIRLASGALMPLMMEPAWRLNTLISRPTAKIPTSRGPMNRRPRPKKEQMEGDGEADVEAESATVKQSVTFGPVLNAKVEAFLKSFTEAIATEEESQGVEGGGATEFDVGVTVDKAIRIAGPNLGGGIETGLARLAVGGESASEANLDNDPEADLNNVESSEFTYDAMTQRAIAAEAALEAILQTPTETLQKEEVMGMIFRGIKKHGPKFLNVGTGLLSNILGVVGGALGIAGSKKKESQMNGEMEADAGDGQEFMDEAAEGEEALESMDPLESAEADFLHELENGV